MLNRSQRQSSFRSAPSCPSEAELSKGKDSLKCTSFQQFSYQKSIARLNKRYLLELFLKRTRFDFIYSNKLGN